MIGKAHLQYDKKVNRDALNELPVFFDTSLEHASKEEVMMKYNIYHHYGLTLDEAGAPIGRTELTATEFPLDIRTIELDQKDLAATLYQLESEQQNYFAARIDHFCKLSSDTKVLDLGSGSGGVTFHLAQKYNPTITGINLSEKQVKMTNKLALKKDFSKVKFFHQDFNKLDAFHADNFDLVLQNETDQYVDDLADFYQNVNARLSADSFYATIGWYATDQKCLHKKVIDGYYRTDMKDPELVVNMLEKNNFTIKHRQDLTEAALHYWYVRSRFQLAKGIIEPEFISGFETKRMSYELIIAQKSL
jgi:geranyl diphosphate 2-C-methyltransferase